MATPNRSALIARTLKVLRKHYKPVPPPKDRSLFEHLLFACLLEDSPQEAAEQVFSALKQDYFGWNEVRVSTIRELTDALKPLVNPAESAARLKQTLHSVFESVYEFDIESLKKQNIGQAAKHLQKYNGTTPFAVAYVTQHALGGHAIPLNRGALITLHTVGVISDDEIRRGVVPGLERAVPKNKGAEVGSLLHQLGVEVGRNPYGPSRPQVDAGDRSELQGSLAEATRRSRPSRHRPRRPPPPTAARRRKRAAEAKKKAPPAKQAPPAKASRKKKTGEEAAAKASAAD